MNRRSVEKHPLDQSDQSSQEELRHEASCVRLSVENKIALLRLSRPPRNMLSDQMRADISKALQDAIQNGDVAAIVILGEGANFSTGTDLHDLDRPEKEPTLTQLCDQIESCSKPVIASLHGATLAGGLALALAAHYRVMGASARLATPEVNLGMVPSGGVTQRLPRLIGAGPALDMMLSGRAINATQAHAMGVVDQIAKKRVGKAAIALAHRVIPPEEGALSGPRPTRDIRRGLSDTAENFKVIQSRRDGLAKSILKAPHAILDCVEAALVLPFEMGLNLETVKAQDCLDGEEFKSFLHAARSEILAIKAPMAPQLSKDPVKKVGLVGTTPLALGLALAALEQGIEVQILDREADGLVVAQNRLFEAISRAEKQGVVSGAEAEHRRAMVQASVDIKALRDCQIVIEALPGTLETRAKVLERVESFLPPEIVLATSAAQNFTEMAQDLAHPERFLAFHAFTPVQLMRAIELACPDNLTDDALSVAHRFAVQIGKVPVVMKAVDGLIANHVQEAAWSAVDVMLLMGATPAKIDQALRRYGFPAGPCETMDTLGLEHVSGAVAGYLAEQGHQGRKSGSGFFRYEKGKIQEDTIAADILTELRALGDLRPVVLSDEDIVQRYVLAQANAGAHLLQNGDVARASDIDVVMMLSKGFPRFRGGPMRAADSIGLSKAVAALQAYAEAEPEIWEPATIWRVLIKNGDCFDSLN